MVTWTPEQPIPFADYEDERDEPPEGLDADDVQRIWWYVSASLSRDELREQLLTTARSGDWGCFVYNPIAELSGRCRYPWPVIELIQEILPPGVIIPVNEIEDVGSLVYGMMIIQVDIWHQLIWKAFDICPIGCLPQDLLELRLERDLGL